MNEYASWLDELEPAPARRVAAQEAAFVPTGWDDRSADERRWSEPSHEDD